MFNAIITNDYKFAGIANYYKYVNHTAVKTF